MAALLCFTPSGGSFTLSEVATSDLCVGGFLAAHQTDYFTLSSLAGLFQTYFAFDTAIFELIIEANLVCFVIGHGLGRLMMVWRKSF